MLRPLHSLLQVGVLGDRSDAELLTEFMTRSKETAEPAFTALVGRHGAMVWRVCRSVLTDPQDAEDAFQATFLVLVQHARSVRRQDSLASWLYGVAYRVACCARSAKARRRKHEELAVAGQARDAHPDEAERFELRSVVAEELNRLSDSYRLAVVLCDVEELTHEQAAARLGWPVGTVKSRLARGRERLRSRLTRRGLAPSVGLIGAALLGEAGLGAPPAALAARAIHSALGASAGLSVAGSVSGVITLVVREVSQAMWISRLRWAAVAVLTSSALGVGGVFLWQRTEARQAPAARAQVPHPSKWNADDDAIWARHFGNLKRIGLAMHNYEAAEGRFPAAAIAGKDGKPLLSWRVAILPYLEDYDGHTRADLHKMFRLDEPWDSPHNKALLARMPAVFAPPGKGDQQSFTTVYRGFVSPEEKGKPGTGGGGAGGMAGMAGMMAGRPGAGYGAAEGMEVMMGAALEQDSSPFGSRTFFRENRGVGIQEITDGTSNTLMVVEAAKAVPWTKPDDLQVPEKAPLPRLGGSMRDGFAALFADGRVCLIDHTIQQRILRNLITPSGGEIVSGDEFPSPNAPPPGKLIMGDQATPADAPQPDESQRYAGAHTLQNAVGILKDKLHREGKSELTEWLTEPRARRAIRAGLQTYETYLREIGEPPLPRQQFEIAKPIFRQIAEHGDWPADCWFSASSGVETRNGITYDHHQARLVLEALDRGKPFQFGILVLDVFYGPVERTSPAQAQ